MSAMSEQMVQVDPEELALGVWQSLPDDHLVRLRFPEFREAVGFEIEDDEAVADAWWFFQQMVRRLADGRSGDGGA